MGQKVKIWDALIWMRQKTNYSFPKLEDGASTVKRRKWLWKDCWCWILESKIEDGGTAGPGVELERTKLKMEGLLVLKEETVATSLAGLVCDPSAFIVEEYSEEVGTSPLFFFEWSNMIFLGWWFQRCRGHEHCPRGLHWPWAKYDHVWGGFSTRYKTGIVAMSFVCKIKEYCGFRCEKLTRALTQCFLEGIALLDRFEFDFWTKEQ